MRITREDAVRMATPTGREGIRRGPLAPRLSRWWLKLRYRWQRRRLTGRLVMPYDEGLISVDLSTPTGHEILFRGYRDPALARAIKHAVRPGDVCIDVGAHIGAYSLVMAFAAGPDGRVIAVEPHPDLAANLAANVALNRLNTVTIVPAAVAREDGTATFHTFPPGEGHNLTASLAPSTRCTQTIMVRTVTGPTLVKELGITRCGLIKTDAGGADMIVFSELFDLIRQQRPCVIIGYRRAWWEKFNTRIEDAVEMLRSLHYDLYVIGCTGDLTFPLEGEVPDKTDLFCVPACQTFGFPGPT